MSTARDLCRKILENSLVGLGQAIEGQLIEDTLDYLNMELSILNNQGAFAPFESVFEQTFIGGQSEYTIGTVGDIVLPRPISISWMKVKSGNTYLPMVQTTQNDFAQNTTSNNGLTTPKYFYYEPTYPLGTIGFGCELNTATDFKIGIKHEITSYALSDEVLLPSGYYPLLLWKTVARIPNIPQSKRLEAKINAEEILASIKSLNTKAVRMKSNFGRGLKYDIHSDTNR